jgi:hypothetical protein
MGGRDDLFTLMRRHGCGGLTHGKGPKVLAEEASECGDPIRESCGQPAGDGEAVRFRAAHPGRGENRLCPLCLLMNPILPGAVHQDLAGETQ